MSFSLPHLCCCHRQADIWWGGRDCMWRGGGIVRWHNRLKDVRQWTNWWIIQTTSNTTTAGRQFCWLLVSAQLAAVHQHPCRRMSISKPKQGPQLPRRWKGLGEGWRRLLLDEAPMDVERIGRGVAEVIWKGWGKVAYHHHVAWVKNVLLWICLNRPLVFNSSFSLASEADRGSAQLPEMSSCMWWIYLLTIYIGDTNPLIVMTFKS